MLKMPSFIIVSHRAVLFHHLPCPLCLIVFFFTCFVFFDVDVQFFYM